MDGRAWRCRVPQSAGLLAVAYTLRLILAKTRVGEPPPTLLHGMLVLVDIKTCG